MNGRSVAIFAIIVAAIVGGAIWFLTGETAPHQSPAPTPAIARSEDPAPAISVPASSPPAQSKFAAQPIADNLPVPEPTVTVTITEDDRRIDEILRSNPGNSERDHENTVTALINAMTGMKPEGQVEAAQHISNLISDETWGKLNHIWRNPAYNADVLEVFHTDLMNRDDKIKLPALMDAVRIPNHPVRDDALATLQIFLDEDYGNDVQKWDAAMKAYLKKQADEEAAANANQ